MKVQKQALPYAVHSCCSTCIRAPVSVVCSVASEMNYALSALFPLEVWALSHFTEQGHLPCKLFLWQHCVGACKLSDCETGHSVSIFIFLPKMMGWVCQSYPPTSSCAQTEQTDHTLHCLSSRTNSFHASFESHPSATKEWCLHFQHLEKEMHVAKQPCMVADGWSCLCWRC